MLIVLLIAVISGLVAYLITRRVISGPRRIVALAAGFAVGLGLTIGIAVVVQSQTHQTDSTIGAGFLGAILGPGAGLQYARKRRDKEQERIRIQAGL